MSWYMTVGSSLCLAMMLNIFSTKASEMGLMMIKLGRRCFDRSCTCSFKKRNKKYDEYLEKKTMGTHTNKMDNEEEEFELDEASFTMLGSDPAIEIQDFKNMIKLLLGS